MSAVLSAYNDPGYSSDKQIAQLRIPPHSIEGESSVLGGLLLDNNAWDRVGDLLTDQDFYRAEHKLIYAAVGALINATKPADVITVYEHLQNQGKADEIGGLSYLNSLAQYVPSASNIRRYAEIVRERAILRKLLTASDEIATQAFNPKGKPVDEILLSPLFEATQPFNQEITLLIQQHKDAIQSGNDQERLDIEQRLQAINPTYFAHFDIDRLLEEVVKGKVKA